MTDDNEFLKRLWVLFMFFNRETVETVETEKGDTDGQHRNQTTKDRYVEGEKK